MLLALQGCWIVTEAELRRHDLGLWDVETGGTPRSSGETGAPTVTGDTGRIPVPCAAVSFDAVDQIPIGSTPSAVAAGDFDGDGWVDVATVDLYSAVLSVGFLSAGVLDTVETLSLTGGLPPCPTDLAAGEAFPGAAGVGLAVVDGCNAEVRVVTGAGRVVAPAPVAALPVDPGAVAAVAASLDADEDDDLAVVSSGGQLWRWLNATTGEWVGTAPFDAGDAAGDLAAGHIEGDGLTDLVVTSVDRVSVLLGRGSADFALGTEVLLADADGAWVADLDADARSDLLATDKSGAVAWARGDGDGGFGSFVPVVPGQGVDVALAVADYAGDGCVSVVAVDFDDGVRFLRGLGDGTFDAPVTVPSAVAGPTGVLAGDLDGAPPLDLAVVGSSTVELLRGVLP